MILKTLCASLFGMISLTASAAPVTTVTIPGMEFVPKIIVVRSGETVNWTNTSNATPPLTHTVTADPARARSPSSVLLPAGAAAFNSGALRQGNSFQQTLTVGGTYKYFCAPHELMGHLGEIVVVTETEVPVWAFDTLVSPIARTVNIGEVVKFSNHSQVPVRFSSDSAVVGEGVGVPAGAEVIDSGEIAPGESSTYAVSISGSYKFVVLGAFINLSIPRIS